jgi:hypothetical protein
MPRDSRCQVPTASKVPISLGMLIKLDWPNACPLIKYGHTY